MDTMKKPYEYPTLEELKLNAFVVHSGDSEQGLNGDEFEEDGV